MQELGKFNLKINVIPNRLEQYIIFTIKIKLLEQYIIFTIKIKLSFIDSFQFLHSSLDSLVKNISKGDFKYLGQEFDNNIFDLVKLKEFYSYEYMSEFGKFKEQLPSK